MAQVDELVLDKQILAEGLQVVHVPGHTPGQIALFEPQRGILIAADALSNRGNKLGLPTAIATPRMDVAMRLDSQAGELKGVQVICFGHGLPITENAAKRLQVFAAGLPNSQSSAKSSARQRVRRGPPCLSAKSSAPSSPRRKTKEWKACA